jgi:hypothetical protein
VAALRVFLNNERRKIKLSHPHPDLTVSLMRECLMNQSVNAWSAVVKHNLESSNVQHQIMAIHGIVEQFFRAVAKCAEHKVAFWIQYTASYTDFVMWLRNHELFVDVMDPSIISIGYCSLHSSERINKHLIVNPQICINLLLDALRYDNDPLQYYKMRRVNPLKVLERELTLEGVMTFINM